VLPRELNAYDVLVSDWLVFSAATLDATARHFSAATVESEATVEPDVSDEPEAADESDEAGDAE
jgi:hypothetical protein